MTTNAAKLQVCAVRLEEIHQEQRRLAGDRWEATYQELAGPMAAEMKLQGITNPIEFVMPVVKLMQSHGKDARMVWAVAVEMCHRIKGTEGLPA